MVLGRLARVEVAMAQTLLTNFFKDEAAPKQPANRAPAPHLVVCLAGDGWALRPWLDSGRYRELVVDARRDPERAAAILAAHRGKIAFACAVLHCPALVTAGARWWKRKRVANPDFQEDAVEQLRLYETLLRSTGAPYVLLTPGSSTLKKLWKPPSATISPNYYGGYLPEDHSHPFLSSVVPSRDRYHRKTHVYEGNLFTFPRKRPLPPVWLLKRSKRTKLKRRVSPLLVKRKYAKRVRRLTPLGFFQALFQLHAG